MHLYKRAIFIQETNIRSVPNFVVFLQSLIVSDEYDGCCVVDFFTADVIEIQVIIFVWPAEEAKSEYDAFF